MKVLFLITDDWYALSHRAGLIRGVIACGGEVTVVTHVTSASNLLALKELGCSVIDFQFDRDILGQFRNLLRVFRLRTIYREQQPDVIHNISFLPCFWGSLARCAGSACVNAVTGLGHAFSVGGVKAGITRFAVKTAYKLACRSRRVRVLFQNEDDLKLFVDGRVIRQDQAVLIRGSGVDVGRFIPVPSPVGTPLVVHASRMLRTKGVEVSIDASLALKARGIDHQLVLAGRVHKDNPESLSIAWLTGFENSGGPRWIGSCDDIPGLFAKASIIVLPTFYREGVPMVLLEAAAAGIPMITSDMPGCRDIVRHGETGLLVPPGDSEALSAAIEQLLSSPKMRLRMGSAARALVEDKFSIEIVVRETLALYESLDS